MPEFNSKKCIVANDDESMRFLHASVVKRLQHEVIALASDGNELIELASKLRPDFILSDLIMPKLNGLDACIHIKKLLPQTKCLITTSYVDFTKLYHRSINKVDGFLFHEITAHKLNLCLERIEQKQMYIDLTYRKDFLLAVQHIKKELSDLSELSELSALSELSELSELSQLSESTELNELNKGATTFDIILHNGKNIKINDRHILLVSAIYHSLGREKIADRLHISEQTVDTTIKRLKQSLSIEDRIQLVRLFKEWGYLRSKEDII